jgi:hypothetical protein
MSDEYSATEWGRYDVPTIAAMLPEDDYSDSWNQVHAWRLAYETIDSHQMDLTTASAQLSETWSPDHSLAAASFFDQVQILKASMTAAANAAAANATALANVIGAVSDARTQIQRLHQNWQLQVTSGLAGETSAHSPDASGQQWTAALNARANEIMTDTDQIVLENSRRMTVPSDVVVTHIEPTKRVPIPKDELRKGGPRQVASGARHEQHGLTSGADPRTDAPPDGMGSTPGHGVGTGSTEWSNVGVPLATTLVGALPAAVGSRTLVATGAAEPTSITTAAEDQLTGTHHMSRQSDDSPGPDGRPRNAKAATMDPAIAQNRQPTTAETGSTSEHGEMLAPGIGVSPRAATPARGLRRRRGQAISVPDLPVVVPGLLVPHTEEVVVHDPGPGVIGAHR